MSIVIREVLTSKDVKRFVKFQLDLFKNDPLYVPPLISDEIQSLTKNPVLKCTKLKMWLAYDGSRIVGRLACMINSHYNEKYKTKRARFGWWDVIDDYEVARLLFDTGCAWAKSEGMTEIHGPVAMNTMGKQGLVVEGFDHEPQATNLYNPEYYMHFVEKYGFTKELDWIQYRLNASQGVPEKLHKISDMLMQRYHLRFLDLTNLKADSPVAVDFFNKFNEAFSHVKNFIPFTDEEIKNMAAFYVKVLRPELNCIVVDENDEVVCFGISFPSLTKAFRKAKGRLFPFGWYHLIHAFKHYDTVDLMLLGAAEKWNNKGVSAIFHTYMATSFKNNHVRYAITNPQIEDNTALNVWDRYEDRELYIRRRCYIKSL